MEVACIKFPDVNDLIVSVKQIFMKSHLRRQFFTTKTSIPLPLKPVITRWGSWIEAACYYAANFDTIISVIFELPDDSIAITTCKNTGKTSLPLDFLATLHFKSIVSSIYKLEKQGQTLNDSLQIVLQC